MGLEPDLLETEYEQMIKGISTAEGTAESK